MIDAMYALILVRFAAHLWSYFEGVYDKLLELIGIRFRPSNVE